MNPTTGLPLATTAGFDQADQDDLQLVRANGEAEETLACFQMLAQLMQLKLRRDQMEKIVSDAMARGKGIICN